MNYLGTMVFVFWTEVFSGVAQRQELHSTERSAISPFLPEEFSLRVKQHRT